MSTLESLWKEVDALHDKQYPGHTLRPILGNGKTNNPAVMFVFINPTARNVSTNRSWTGPRFPFIGTKQVWRIFHRAGLLSTEILQRIEKSPKEWSLALTNDILAELKARNLYITNIVKWAGHDAALPDKKKILTFLPLLEREIELVKPHRIITFGLIPFEHLAREKVTLGEYHRECTRTGKLKEYTRTIGKTNVKIIPCYFPVGRGDPKKAVELLKLL